MNIVLVILCFYKNELCNNSNTLVLSFMLIWLQFKLGSQLSLTTVLLFPFLMDGIDFTTAVKERVKVQVTEKTSPGIKRKKTTPVPMPSGRVLRPRK